MKRFRKLAVGGTFDLFHTGHKATLLKAFALSERVLIGVTSDQLAARQGKRHKVEPYASRVTELREFLRREKLDERAEIIPINSKFGVADMEPNLDTILVSDETYQVALDINRAREKTGLKRLEIVLNEKLSAEDGGSLSSTRIRSGEIDRQGHILKRI